MNDDKNKGVGRTPDGQEPHRAGKEDPSAYLDQKRKKKVESFQLNLDEDAVDASEDISGLGDSYGSDSAVDGENLNSYSEEFQKQKDTRTSEEKKAERAAVRAEKKRKKRKAKKNGCLFKLVWLVMVLLVSVVLAQYIMVGVNDMLAINRQQAGSEELTVSVNIPSYSSLDDVAKILADAHVINKPDFFKLYTKLTTKETDEDGDGKKDPITFSKGEYQMRTDMDYEAILNYIWSESNRTDIVKIMFPEGMNVRECAEKLEEANICKADDFLKVCNSDEFDDSFDFLKNMTNREERYYKLEGYLFPDTYEFYEDSDPAQVARRMLNRFEEVMHTKVKMPGYVEKMSPMDVAEEKGISLSNLIIVASMAQSEGADAEDMKGVASVFYNRLNPELNEGVTQLNSDPTVYYPYRSREEAPEGFESRYDTYNIVGLPAGPICNPGAEGLTAALFPDNHGYLYFCHNPETREAYYATTAEEHAYNLQLAGLVE